MSRVGRVEWSDEEIIEAMRKFYKLNGYLPNSRQLLDRELTKELPSYPTVCRRFRSMENLLKAVFSPEELSELKASGGPFRGKKKAT